MLNRSFSLSAFLFGCMVSVMAVAGTTMADITATQRGAIVETAQCKVEIVDGVIVQITNRLTDEKYLRTATNLTALTSEIPAGFGTLAGNGARESAAHLYRWPWFEMPAHCPLTHQHSPTANSQFKLKNIDHGAVLIYTGLSNGSESFADESFEITVQIEQETQDILLTPTGHSPRPTVFSSTITMAPTARLITIDAPIFDGVRLTGDMKTNLWTNLGPENWDYPLMAFNGEETGAVGFWAQDAERHYKGLFYKGDGSGIATSFCTVQNPPFDKLNSAQGVTWHLQAFDKSWAQVSARYRQWRDKNLKLAPRPQWTQQISFVNSGVHAGKGWLDLLSAYLEGEHLERTATFMATIRAAGFDTKHWDNTPYPKFHDETAAWKASGAKSLAYLQPMIMWGSSEKEEDLKIIRMAQKADTQSAFTDPPKSLMYVDQHHLGEPAWQAWFLNWVKTYIDLGADGIYHDQSYPCPIDGRGLINGMNSAQGMADYFYKAATQSPNSIHASEHMQEANSVGVSLGIGSGVLWGTAPTMRMQRINHGSPISNSLHHGLGAIWGFPHYSDLARHDVTLFHMGMDQMERRGDLAGLALQNGIYDGKTVPFNVWVNEFWLDRKRSLTFVRKGLRPIFPEDYNRSVRTYFKGAQGEDLRYEDRPWGSEFVEYVAPKDQPKAQPQRQVIYGRVKDATHATTPGTISGWLMYNEQGPTGLNPNRYYVIDPAGKKPTAYFEPGFAVLPDEQRQPTLYESYVDNCAGNDAFLWLNVRILENLGRIIKADRVRLVSTTEPKLVLVDGKPVKPAPRGPGVWEIGFESPAQIVVFLKDIPAGFNDLKSMSLGRWVGTTNMDIVQSSWVSGKISAEAMKISAAKIAANPALYPATPLPAVKLPSAGGLPGTAANELHIPLQLEGDKPQTLRVHLAPGAKIALNGQLQESADNLAQLTIKPGQPVLISLFGPAELSGIFEQVASASK